MSICYLLDGETPPARKNGKSLPCVLLQAENDKLRELVRESVSFERYGCYGCSREDTCEPQEIYDEECIRRQGIEQSMRELGVEV